ncbi:MAG: acyl-CoA dehydrogenase family protein, partial [Candidatus Brocadiae bacterium]|nr:acyl-CoA dehydrogenase family protein [Candidatus Brocadiia bacterium]
MAFEGLDFYNVDAHLSDEERMVRDLVRGWVDDNVIPVIEEHCRKGTFPRHLVPQIGEMGLLGMNLEGYGCAGMSNVAYGLACQEMERGDSGLR